MTIFEGLTLGGRGEAKHRQISAYLASLVAAGRLKPGDRLPPVRQAAWSLGIHPGTMARAYRALEARGLAHGEIGRGTFIGPDVASRGAGIPMPDDADHAIDLAINRFAIAAPRAALAEALEAGAAGLRGGTLAMSYVSEYGHRADREAILPWLAARLGMLQPDQILLTNGGQSGLHSALSAFAGPGSGAACDALTYPGTIAAAAQLGIPLAGIPMDDEGMLPDALEDACSRRSISVLILSCGINNPTGITMPRRRREAIAEVAARHRLTVVEDEVYGFLVEDDLPPLARLLPEQTVYLVSLSKLVAPALRVGYLAGPVPLIRRAALAHKNTQMMVSPFLSAAATHTVRSGLLERRRALLMGEVRQRFDAACTVLGIEAGPLRPSGLLWLRVPERWRPGDFCREAEREGVLVSPADLFAVEVSKTPQAVRVSLTAEADQARLMRGIETVARLLRTENPVPAAML